MTFSEKEKYGFDVTPDLVRRVCAEGLLDQKTVRGYFAGRKTRESSRLRIEQALQGLRNELPHDSNALLAAARKAAQEVVNAARELTLKKKKNSAEDYTHVRELIQEVLLKLESLSLDESA